MVCLRPPPPTRASSGLPPGRGPSRSSPQGCGPQTVRGCSASSRIATLAARSTTSSSGSSSACSLKATCVLESLAEAPRRNAIRPISPPAEAATLQSARSASFAPGRCVGDSASLSLPIAAVLGSPSLPIVGVLALPLPIGAILGSLLVSVRPLPTAVVAVKAVRKVVHPRRLKSGPPGR